MSVMHTYSLISTRSFFWPARVRARAPIPRRYVRAETNLLFLHRCAMKPLMVMVWITVEQQKVSVVKNENLRYEVVG